jgi:MarR family transcriptional regulator, organic hydroperoxide resistance regulator
MDNQTRNRAEADIGQAPDRLSRADLVLEGILPYQLNRLTFHMNRLLNKDLRRQGLSIGNWRVLAVLDFNEKATVNELADYAMIEQPTVSRLIARMEKDGLLRRDRIARDGRVRSISLTAAGREKYEAVRAMTLAHAERALRGLSDEDKQTLRRSVATMQRNLKTQKIDLK